MLSTLLTVENLRTYFFTPEGVVKAVDDISFELLQGKTLGVLGESGSGKSVTALSIMRLIPDPPGKIVSGSMLFEGKDLAQVSKSQLQGIRGNQIAMIFQEPMTALNPVFTIGDQIAEVYMAHENLNKKQALTKSIELLKLVGIPAPQKRLKDYPHQLSGGMRQRAMIAIAMACNPKLLIADEPTTALDVTIQAQILDLMLELQESLNMAIMMITHDLGVIAEVSDQLMVMYAGEVVEYLPVDRLFTDARHPYTLGLIRSIPQLGRRIKSVKRPLPEIPGIVPTLIDLPPGCLFAPRCNSVFDKCYKHRPPLFPIGPEIGGKCWLLEKETCGG